MRRVGAHIEDVDLAVVETAGPEIFAIVREPHVMRLTAAADGNLVNHFPVSLGGGIRINRDQLVRSIAQARHPERPHVHEIFLAFDQPRHVGRIASLVRVRTDRGDTHDDGNAEAQDQSAIDSHDDSPYRCSSSGR